MSECDQTRALRHRVVQAFCEGRGPRPMCRDCADEDGRCPSSGELCDSFEGALEYLAKPHEPTAPSSQERAVLEAAEAYERAYPVVALRTAERLVETVRTLRASRRPAGKRPEEGWYWLREIGFRNWEPMFFDGDATVAEGFELGPRIQEPKR